MDRNQKAAIIALIAVVILILAAIILLAYEVQTEGLPDISLPDISLPQWLHPGGTEAPATFSPFDTPLIPAPQISIPPLATPQVPMPRSRTTPALSPSAQPHVTPPPEAVYESVFFGRYEQGEGPAPIEWLVLEKRGDRCLLISRYALDVLRYHGIEEPVTWETCGLRLWLNTDFLAAAFSQEERAAILVTEVDNSVGNPIFDIDGGNNTEDRIFLLSKEEVEHYFPTEGERLCQPTRPIKSAGLLGYISWWLRSPGYKPSYAEYVNSNGAYLSGDVDRNFTAIRPVLWVMSDRLP